MKNSTGTNKTKILMMVAVSKALEYKKKNPKATMEEIFQYIMKEIPASGKTKAATIAAVNKALQYQERESMNEKEILQKVMGQLDLIIESLE